MYVIGKVDLDINVFKIKTILVTAFGRPYGCVAWKCTVLQPIVSHGNFIQKRISKTVRDGTLSDIPFANVLEIIHVFDWNDNSYIVISDRF